MAAAETFKSSQVGMAGPCDDGEIVVPSDSADLNFITRALLISADATVKVTTAKGTTLSLPLVKGWNPIRVSRVWLTGTDTVTIFGMR